MRALLLSLSFLPASLLAAQDAAQQQMMITQQNLQIQAAQQANQQAIQAVQQGQFATQQMNQDAASALQMCDQCQRASAPRPSLKPGAYPASVTIRLTSRTRHAVIFYTTDGWTPTTQSIPYTGPITIDATQTLRAIAVAPGSARSAIAALTYTLPATAVPTPLTGNVIPAGTPLRLRVLAPLDSATAYVGQPVQVALAEDLFAAGRIIASAGTPARAQVTQVDPAHRASQPGSVTFIVKSIQIDGREVPLNAVRTLEAGDHPGRQALFLVPVVGAASALRHGDTARIPAGAELVARTPADSTL